MTKSRRVIPIVAVRPVGRRGYDLTGILTYSMTAAAIGVMALAAHSTHGLVRERQGLRTALNIEVFNKLALGSKVSFTPVGQQQTATLTVSSLSRKVTQTAQGEQQEWCVTGQAAGPSVGSWPNYTRHLTACFAAK